MEIQTNFSLQLEVVGVLVVVTFVVTGPLMMDSSVLVQNVPIAPLQFCHMERYNKIKPHRSRDEIVNEILWIVLSRNQSPSSLYMCKLMHIAYGARLTYEQTLGYTESLVESGFLLKKQSKSGLYRYYEITEKGRRYLQIYFEIQDDLRPCFEIQYDLRPCFEIQDDLRLEKVDTEANAWL